MIVVAEASPLVFLGKIRQLDLLQGLFGDPILVPAEARAELLGPPIPADEQRTLDRFLGRAQIEEMDPPQSIPGLSRADTTALALATQRGADLLLADDRLLRRVAQVEGIRPMGTLGVLLRAVAHGLLVSTAAERLVRELIRTHRFRISIEVFEGVLSKLAEEAEGPVQL